MTEWWDEQTAGLIGAVLGGGLGSLIGIFGAIMGTLAPRGILRTPVLATHLTFVGIGVAVLIAGVYALVVAQPFHVYMPLLGAGFLICAIMIPLYPVARLRYRQAEHRRVEAEALRRS